MSYLSVISSNMSVFIVRMLTPFASAFSRQRLSAASLMSARVTSVPQIFAMLMPMQPDPAHKSRQVLYPRRFISAIASSQSVSVSCRGISARASVLNLSPMNSQKPSMYCSGSPVFRRKIYSRNLAYCSLFISLFTFAASSARLPMPNECITSSRASISASSWATGRSSSSV